ncbi:MAG: hypothetical protein ACOCRX_01470 [Candidatus Woesearchaeota archaeon]
MSKKVKVYECQNMNCRKIVEKSGGPPLHKCPECGRGLRKIATKEY